MQNIPMKLSLESEYEKPRCTEVVSGDLRVAVCSHLWHVTRRCVDSAVAV